MEQYFKFALWGVIFTIYLVSQLRKMRKQAEAKKVLPPEPAKPLVAKPMTAPPSKAFDYKGKREMKGKQRKSVFAQKEEDKPVVYKPVADEELMAEALLEERKQEEKVLKQDRKPLADEHLQPYAEQPKSNMNLNWLKDKANLKRTFIAAEIFQKKY